MCSYRKGLHAEINLKNRVTKKCDNSCHVISTARIRPNDPLEGFCSIICRRAFETSYPSELILKMNSSSNIPDPLSDGIQLLRLAEKHPSILTPPPSDDSQKSHKSTSDHSDHESSNDKSAYIGSLEKEREHLAQFGEPFHHVFTLIDKEIKRVGREEEDEKTVTSSKDNGAVLSEIITVPVDQYPTYNFVGRILGPRGTTAKQLEATTGCRVTILGRNKKDGPVNSGDSSVDNGPLRVQISCPSDASDAAKRLEAGATVIKALLVPPADGQDELKRQQLMVLANMNGTYRPRTTVTSPSSQFPGSGDYSGGHQFQNLLPYGYRLPGKSHGHHDAKLDCFNPKCAILRSLVDQNNNNNNHNIGSISKIDDVLNMMHMYELMNRIRLANSSFVCRNEEVVKAQEIGNRMCSSINVSRKSLSTNSNNNKYRPHPSNK